jgi:hypothetical protein
MEELADMLLRHAEGMLTYCRIRIPLAMMEFVNSNIEAQLRRRRGGHNLACLLPRGQRLVAKRSLPVAFKKAAKTWHSQASCV